MKPCILTRRHTDHVYVDVIRRPSKDPSDEGINATRNCRKGIGLIDDANS